MGTCVAQSPEVTVHIFYHFQVEQERVKPFQIQKMLGFLCHMCSDTEQAMIIFCELSLTYPCL